MVDAACRGHSNPSIFFPEKGDSSGVIRSRKICAQCPVANECLKYALKNTIALGIWGGLTESERQALSKKRAKRVDKCYKCGLIKVFYDKVTGVCDRCSGITKADRRNLLNQPT